MNRLEHIAEAYWEVGTALRHPKAPAITTQKALTRLNASDRLRPEEWKLRENMHTLRFDIIEGSTKWRKDETRRVSGSASILHMER